jgi:outer membrane protein TolC
VQLEAPVREQWQEADSAPVTRTPADQIRWSQVFDDPVLSKLIETAVERNYNLKIAVLRVLEARAQPGTAVGVCRGRTVSENAPT